MSSSADAVGAGRRTRCGPGADGAAFLARAQRLARPHPRCTLLAFHRVRQEVSDLVGYQLVSVPTGQPAAVGFSTRRPWHAGVDEPQPPGSDPAEHAAGAQDLAPLLGPEPSRS